MDNLTHRYLLIKLYKKQ